MANLLDVVRVVRSNEYGPRTCLSTFLTLVALSHGLDADARLLGSSWDANQVHRSHVQILLTNDVVRESGRPLFAVWQSLALVRQGWGKQSNPNPQLSSQRASTLLGRPNQKHGDSGDKRTWVHGGKDLNLTRAPTKQQTLGPTVSASTIDATADQPQSELDAFSSLAGLDISSSTPQSAAPNNGPRLATGPNVERWFEKLVCTAEGVLYEDVQIQIGISSPGTKVTQHILLGRLASVCVHPATYRPDQVLRKHSSGSPRVPRTMEAHWWTASREAQTVFPVALDSAGEPDLQRYREALAGSKLIMLEGVDPNPNNLVAAGVLHMSDDGKVGCLLRLEPNKEVKLCRLTIRSTSEDVAAEVQKLIQKPLRSTAS
ncbi:alpha adaptin AP2, C-terminal domain-containing protein [Pterulicium gracile]|uniref:Alpha adaptin AP2, C-terminal domain-containing protein n=1 Tax=Pterulicium gracile TaxID=1884261 RepID=A0A5C3QUT6_9AGAR|nr:alpha adaptin AP2, C-terminal domain-containing protein [Pterula gracilis]